MAGAAVASGAVYYLGHAYLPPFVPVIMVPSERVVYALGWQVVTMLPLVLGIARIAQRRFFSEAAIDGGEADEALDVDRRYLQNTLEQTLLAVVAQLCLALRVPATSLRIVVVAALWFFVARICFWVGYHRSPVARSFGFAATFYPSVGTVLYCLVHILG